MKHILTVLSLCLLAGCTTTSAPTKEEMASFRPENMPMVYDDPRPLFEALFPHGSPLKKGDLETQSEFQARLDAVGYANREFTFLIAPKFCKVIAFPDNGFYVICSKETYYTGYDVRRKPYGITVDSIEEEPRHYVGQNAFGATTEVTSYRGTMFQLSPVDFLRLPRLLKWDDGSSFGRFGLAIRIADPVFRQKLKEEKIGLAVRVRIGDLTKLDSDFENYEPTITHPTGFSYMKPLLPVVLLDGWIVDTETNISLVHWRNEKG
jgi:hypothetical protein